MNTAIQTKLPPIDAGFDMNSDLPVLVFGLDVTHAACADFHSHPRGQLVYASQGLMFVYTPDHLWVIPPSQCLWIPPHINHQVEFKGKVSLKNIFIHPSETIHLPQTCALWMVSPLLKALLERAVHYTTYTSGTREARLMNVILDELSLLAPSALHLPLPQDTRLQKLVTKLVQQSTPRKSVDYWADVACLSVRHLTRLFVEETGLTFANWYNQWVLLQSMELLTKGTPVATVAIESGYQTPSAFIEAFKKTFGKTPGTIYKTTL